MTATPVRTVWASLLYFKRSEFKHPDAMDPVFLRFVDRVRQHFGDVLLIISDGRALDANAAATGSSKTSLHLFDLTADPPKLASAADFGIHYAAERKQVWEQVWNLDTAIRRAIEEGYTGDRGVEFEPVVNDGVTCAQCGKRGPTDRHFHLALFPDNRPHRMVLSWT